MSGDDESGGSAGPGDRESGGSEEPDGVDPRDLGPGPAESPPIEEKPYKLVFEAGGCIGAGHCAAASNNWTLDLETGVARPESYFRSEAELAAAVEAAERCPARGGDGVVHVVDRRTGEELAPDPAGDGTFSADW